MTPVGAIRSATTVAARPDRRGRPRPAGGRAAGRRDRRPRRSSPPTSRSPSRSVRDEGRRDRPPGRLGVGATNMLLGCRGRHHVDRGRAAVGHAGPGATPRPGTTRSPARRTATAGCAPRRRCRRARRHRRYSSLTWRRGRLRRRTPGARAWCFGCAWRAVLLGGQAPGLRTARGRRIGGGDGAGHLGLGLSDAP